MAEAHDVRVEPTSTEDISVISYEPSEAVVAPRRRGSWLKLLSFFLLALLCFALWFVFTARAVWFQPNPTTASVTVTGGVFRFQWKDHYLMLPGEYQVEALHEGYYPLTQTIVVGDAASQEVELVLAKLPGKLRFEFDPLVDPVLVQVGDKYQLTNADGELEVPAGDFSLVVSSPRYQNFETDLEVVGLGRTQIIDVALKPNWADVSVRSEPSGADVYVGDERIGQTPGVFEILAGEHELSVRLRGYKRWFRTLNLSAKQELTIDDIKLIKADGTVSVKAQPRAAISVNGQYKGMSPQTFKLPPGKRYTISASKVGYRKASRQVVASSDEDVSLDFNLEILYGTVIFTVSPSSIPVTLWSDGQRIGRAGEAIELAVKDHVIEVRADGYATQSFNVLPNPDKSKTLTVELLTLSQAREAELTRKQKIQSADGQVLVLMRPKPFTMGASRRVRGRRSNETLMEVSLSTPYYIATKEVSNRQFKAFLASHKSGTVFKESLEDPDLPVVNVNWQQAAEYCNWLSLRDGLPPAYVDNNGALQPVNGGNTGYRLPTEQEWAWAARFSGGRKQSLFPWGETDVPPTEYGNFAGLATEGMVKSVMNTYKDGFAATSPVGHFAADAAGLYDMSGNVSEWVQDVYRVGDYAPGAGSAAHVLRGSSWQHARVGELRATYRDFSDRGRNDLGFRIARDFD